MGKIFDFSQWQGLIDFIKVKIDTGLVILRVQSGSTHPDTMYATNVAGAKANKIPFGTYAYARFISLADAIQEAKDCLARMDKDSKFVVVDVEEVDCPANELVQATQAYIDYLHQHGVAKVGLYSGESFYKEYGLSAVKADFLWIANYGVDDGQPHNKPSVACDLWQYSSTASEQGVVGHVDISELAGSKTLSYFVGENVQSVQPASVPAVFSTKTVIVGKLQSVANNDIRKAPSHKAEFVRNTTANELFDIYDILVSEGDIWCAVGGANWVCLNHGQNAHIV